MTTDFDPYHDNHSAVETELGGPPKSLKEQQKEFIAMNRRLNIYTLVTALFSLIVAILTIVLYSQTNAIDIGDCRESSVRIVLIVIIVLEILSSFLGVLSASLQCFLTGSLKIMSSFWFCLRIILFMLTTGAVVLVAAYVWSGSCRIDSDAFWIKSTVYLSLVFAVQLITIFVSSLLVCYGCFSTSK
ncbi:potassium voltage-gated channel subfamily KQT member [Acrasis kona]|uniref:Potassium voltage-gated channel subfamily KQT member n=1 Tax=Acrasis kona TaxID=1008807 RepID=A0AAW2ZQX4_9EUKA